MRGVGQQRQRAREQRTDELDDQHARGQGQDNGQAAPVAGRAAVPVVVTAAAQHFAEATESA